MKTLQQKSLKVWLLAASSLVIAIVVVLCTETASEPSYDGKPLRFWLGQLDTKSARDGTCEAAIAIRAMGSNALPVLISMLSARDPGWKRWLTQQRWFPFRLHTAAQTILQGSFGLGCLREQAVPTLEQLLTNGPTTSQAAIAFGRMSPIGATSLANGLTNTDWYVRFRCAEVLSAVGTWKQEDGYEIRVAETAQITIPALITCLRDTNVAVAQVAARALANLNEQPETTLSALAFARTNAALDPSVRASASKAFEVFKSRRESR